MFIAYQNRKIEEQQAKIIKTQAEHPKTITKKEYVKADTIYITVKSKLAITGATSATLKPNGDIAVGGTNLSIKSESELASKEEKKESGKDFDASIPVYTADKKESLWLGISTVHIDSGNDLLGIKVDYINGWWKVSASYYRDFEISELAFNKISGKWRQTFAVDVMVRVFEW